MPVSLQFRTCLKNAIMYAWSCLWPTCRRIRGRALVPGDGFLLRKAGRELRRAWAPPAMGDLRRPRALPATGNPSRGRAPSAVSSASRGRPHCGRARAPLAAFAMPGIRRRQRMGGVEGAVRGWAGDGAARGEKGMMAAPAVRPASAAGPGSA
jgi:hypothetical protein